MLFPKASALNTFFDTTGGITVNRKLNLKGPIALTTSILLLTLWAPPTLYAESNANPGSGNYTVTSDAHECAHCKLLHSAKGRPCPHSHQHSSSGNDHVARRLGFSEVDPAAGLIGSRDPNAVASNHEVSKEYVGFAELDPANLGKSVALITPKLAKQPLWQDPVGFAESDPAEKKDVTERIPGELLTACYHMGTSSTYPSPSKVSGHASLEDHS
jgi:hypothetical protein